MKQLRPIGLWNVNYKIITKVITNKLKTILPKCVSPFQSSFVQNRQITNNILVYQEVLHSMQTMKGNRGYMAIKIDLEKAYDRLSWDFIQDTLDDVGFNSTWVRIIMECIRTPRMAVLWKGKRLHWFRPSRGVRQGDAMSLAIFVLCIERLSRMIC